MLTNYTPTVSVPNDSSQAYADGWTYGDWWVSQGGDLYADAGTNWSDEKAGGFWDRLHLARKQTRKVGCEDGNGLLRIHLESESCDVCKSHTYDVCCTVCQGYGCLACGDMGSITT